MKIKLSLIVPVLASHEGLRRQLLHLEREGLPPDTELIIVDDGSDPPLYETVFPSPGPSSASTSIYDPCYQRSLHLVSGTPRGLPVSLLATEDHRPWTWALARNAGARLAQGEYLLMYDLDHIVTREIIDFVRASDFPRIGFRRKFAVLTEEGVLTYDRDVLAAYGLLPRSSLRVKSHHNSFAMKRELFWKLGGYREDLIGKPYPQGEDSDFWRKWLAYRDENGIPEPNKPPTLYVFPTGRFCGDVDYNQHGLFHNLSRKSHHNYWWNQQRKSEMPNGFAKDLTVIIPGRREMFMAQTVEDVLAHAKADTEVIAILDEEWPPLRGIQDHPKVKVVKTTTPIGQRAATNLGAQMSRAKYIMKLDAHCALDDGFDVKMLEDMQPGDVMTPQMYRLWAFDWRCNECGHGEYQGSKPEKCPECGKSDFYMGIVWEPKWSVGPTISWRFDADMHFQYWTSHRKRPEVQEQVKTGIVETMSCVGCCFLMERRRFLYLGGVDEGHGSWGGYGSEIACKAWLSGGRLVTSLKTHFAHLFRTGNFSANGESTFPYPLSGAEQEAARAYSRNLWLNNRYHRQKRPLSWLVEKFWPVDGWTDEDLANLKERERDFVPAK